MIPRWLSKPTGRSPNFAAGCVSKSNSTSPTARWCATFTNISDRRKDALLQENGILVLRFLAGDLAMCLDSTLNSIQRALARDAGIELDLSDLDHTMLPVEFQKQLRERFVAGNLARASDEKLRVYSLVLKEQIAEIKERTRLLIYETEYHPIRRFLSPFADRVQVPVFKHELQEEIDYLSSTTSHLRAGGVAAVRTIHQFADQHARIFGI